MWLIVSVVLQFVLIGVLAVVVLSLARQIGILHERTAPASLVKNAPAALAPGQQLEALTVKNLADETLTLNADASPLSSALLFISADCPICRSVLPAYAQALDQHKAEFRGYWVGDGLDGGRFADYAANNGIDVQQAVLSQELGLRLGIRELPALVLLDADNRLLLREVLTGPRQLTSIFAQWPVAANPSGENNR